MNSPGAKVVRTHDNFYAQENQALTLKQSFVEAANFVEEYRNSLGRPLQIVDVGAATGAFLAYLNQRMPHDKKVGLEPREDLISAAKVWNPHVEMVQGSVDNRDAFPESSVDVVSMLGVIGIFDDIVPVVANIAHWTRPGGRAVVSGLFNPFNIEVLVKYRKKESGSEDDSLESGWNIFSQQAVADIFLASGAVSVAFKRFEIAVEIQPRADDPVRSWTERLEGGNLQVVNGLWIKQPQYFCIADF